MTDFGLDFSIAVTGDPDPTLPWADDDDQLLVPGSLFLFELAHSANPFAGVPANGNSIPNIAWKRLKDQLGSGDVNSLAGTFAASGLASNMLVMERTTKGGLHGIVTQTNQVGNIYAKITPPSALLTYLLANPTHSYYVSLWYRQTRVAITSGLGANVTQPKWEFVNSSTITANLLAYLNASEHVPTGGNLIGQTINPGPNTTASDTFAAIGVSGWTGTVPADTAHFFAEMGWGSLDGYNSAPWYNRAGSWIMDRWYMEDLTVSGRTYAQVAKADQDLQTAAVAAGGRYYGDTFTAPAI